VKDYFKYFFVIVIVILGYLSYLVVEPFIGALLTGLILAYVFHPIFKRLNKRIKSEKLTAFLMSLAIIILVTVPTAVILKETSEEARFFYITSKQKLFNGNIFDVQCQDPTSSLCHSLDYIKDMLAEPTIRTYVEQAILKFSDFVLEEASGLIFSLPRIFINAFVAFFVCFYATLEGKHWVDRTKKLLPIRKRFQHEIFNKIDNITHGVIYGSVIVALIQGALGGLGFFIFGVNSPILFGILMSVFALIPLLGTALVWGPAALIMLIEGYIEGQTGLLWRGALLLLYGILVISSIDNILKPRLIGGAAKVHPVLILLGVMGGIYLLGFIGFVVGPLILTLFMAFLEVYEREKEVFFK